MNIICWRRKSYHMCNTFVYNKTLNRKIRKRNIGKVLKELNNDNDNDIKNKISDKFIKRVQRIPITEKNPSEAFFKYGKCMNRFKYSKIKK